MSFRRWATSFRRPRREWLSFLWVLKCSVSVVIREVRIATWTSGEPVSPSFVANSLMIFVFSSAVIDIGVSFSGSWHKPGCRPARPMERSRAYREENRAWKDLNSRSGLDVPSDLRGSFRDFRERLDLRHRGRALTTRDTAIKTGGW